MKIFAVILITVILIFAALFTCDLLKDCTALVFPMNLEFMLNRYQTLITGLIALAVGFFTVQHLKFQIDQAKELEKEKKLSNTLSYAGHVEIYLQSVKLMLELAKKSQISTLDNSDMREWDHLKNYFAEKPHFVDPENETKSGLKDMFVMMGINTLIVSVHKEITDNMLPLNLPQNIDKRWLSGFSQSIDGLYKTISTELETFEGHNEDNRFVPTRVRE